MVARLARIPILAAALALVVAAACSDAAPTPGNEPAPSIAAQPTPAASSPAGAQAAPASQPRELSVAEVVKLLEPSVVRVAQQAAGRDIGVGTGFVVGSDGYIMTNNHVVVNSTGRAVQIAVTLSDGSVYPATIVGTDPRTDTALLKIEATGLRAVKWGSLAETEVGQEVVAIGYALDLKGGEGPAYTVTRGIVSAKNRGIAESTTILGSIQTDAAINHGNSGGPLVNLFGEVVGMNTAIAPDLTTGGVAAGIGFAVGVDTLEAVYDALRESGKVNRGLLGVSNFEALRPAKARDLGLSEDQAGVLIGQVAAGGPAASAGLRAGDVITRLGDFDLKTEADLAVSLIKHHAGETVTVEFYRGGSKQSVRVTLGTPPD
jgi:serine protease Do